MANLIEGIQAECNLVRELISHYEELAPTGAFGAAALKADIREGEAAIASGDIARMVRALQSLISCQ
jgi:hypothetical protein